MSLSAGRFHHNQHPESFKEEWTLQGSRQPKQFIWKIGIERSPAPARNPGPKHPDSASEAVSKHAITRAWHGSFVNKGPLQSSAVLATYCRWLCRLARRVAAHDALETKRGVWFSQEVRVANLRLLATPGDQQFCTCTVIPLSFFEKG